MIVKSSSKSWFSWPHRLILLCRCLFGTLPCRMSWCATWFGVTLTCWSALRGSLLSFLINDQAFLLLCVISVFSMRVCHVSAVPLSAPVRVRLLPWWCLRRRDLVRTTGCIHCTALPGLWWVPGHSYFCIPLECAFCLSHEQPSRSDRSDWIDYIIVWSWLLDEEFLYWNPLNENSSQENSVIL